MTVIFITTDPTVCLVNIIIGGIVGLTDAVVGAVGYLALPLIGYPAVASATAPTLGIAMLILGASGAFGALLFIPCMLLSYWLSEAFEGRENLTSLHFCLQFALFSGALIASAALGAAFIGVAVNPIALCILAGTVTIGLGLLAISGLCAALSGASECLEAPSVTLNR